MGTNDGFRDWTKNNSRFCMKEKINANWWYFYISSYVPTKMDQKDGRMKHRKHVIKNYVRHTFKTFL